MIRGCASVESNQNSRFNANERFAERSRVRLITISGPKQRINLSGIRIKLWDFNEGEFLGILGLINSKGLIDASFFG